MECTRVCFDKAWNLGGRGIVEARTKAWKMKVGGVGVGPGKRLHLWFPGEQQMEESAWLQAQVASTLKAIACNAHQYPTIISKEMIIDVINLDIRGSLAFQSCHESLQCVKFDSTLLSSILSSLFF